MEYFEKNQSNWDNRAAAHDASQEVAAALANLEAGGTTLDALEVELLGDVSGQKILHLMCHNGLDSIAMHRMGAAVTGMDLSNESLAFARSYATNLGADGITFIQGDAQERQNELPANHFDWVVMTYGVLCWLQNLGDVFQHIQHYLRPGGRLLLIDHHPLLDLLTFDGEQVGLDGEYFWSAQPERCLGNQSYIGDTQLSQPVSYQWSHDIGSILSQLGKANLRLQHFQEHPWILYQRYPFLIQDGMRFTFPRDGKQIPMMFSLIGQKEASR